MTMNTSTGTIEEQIDETDSDVAMAILVLAREIRDTRRFLDDFSGHSVGGTLDQYVEVLRKALEAGLDGLAGAVTEQGTGRR